MSVENKIKELLARKATQEQLTEESAENLNSGAVQGSTGVSASAKMSKDTSKASKAATAGDTSKPKQGDSKDASYSEMDETEVGTKTASGITKDTSLPKSKGDAKSVKVAAMEETEETDEVITEDEVDVTEEEITEDSSVEETEEEPVVEDVDISAQLNSIFGEELSEEFKQKATSIFEAAVIARVNNEMAAVTEKLSEHAQQQVDEHVEFITNKVNMYLDYVVEQWMEENALQIESGLRTEIAEDFITGLKALFKEHYIEVPEEKFDVLANYEVQTEELTQRLDAEIAKSVQLAEELQALKAKTIFEEQAKGLADTEVAKFAKLVEGIKVDSDDLYREKLSVIKENYFPKAAKSSPEVMLVEDAAASDGTTLQEANPTIDAYAKFLSRVK